ncbi:hypothetical protein H112_02280 [Trichophyton rubrum D6]|nr:hypothetical protein H100_02280 [Trichophyton rubrum MR850]EZF65681.1 hypothetical protein H104_02263 [Trichophyton rubrum CBS 289.86]EZG19320.1 hypothetical protein H107_02356 [Trichophyton rubrum CBS 202.88]KDB36164.1 hypothetical protein H112_02280 [Trichophyton rubrum D6]KMQ42972.1 hypothetical protein HL42_6310 [Trichophyton rubrum]
MGGGRGREAHVRLRLLPSTALLLPGCRAPSARWMGLSGRVEVLASAQRRITAAPVCCDVLHAAVALSYPHLGWTLELAGGTGEDPGGRCIYHREFFFSVVGRAARTSHGVPSGEIFSSLA